MKKELGKIFRHAGSVLVTTDGTAATVAGTFDGYKVGALLSARRSEDATPSGYPFKNGLYKLFFLAALCLTTGKPVPAQETININSEVSLLRSAHPVVRPEGSLRTRYFDFNPGLRQLTGKNKGDTLVLDFFEDSKYKAVIYDVTVGYDGVLGITARIVDNDFAACFISVSKTGISIRADFPANDEHYRAANANDGAALSQYSLSEVRKKTLTSDKAVLPSPSSSTEQFGQSRSVQMRAADDIEAQVTIDVMVAYTAKARQWAEQNVTSIDNAISMAFQYANYVLDNSQVNITLNMVYKYETDYSDDPENEHPGANHLGALQAQDDGKLDEVHALRRQYKADLVVLMPIDGGVAFLPGRDCLTSPDPTGGFSVSSVEGAAYSTTVVHEIGHNLGAGHHWQQVDETNPEYPGVFTYSSAWFGRGANGRWYFTVMSYTGDSFSPKRLPSTMIPYFANPDITVNGVRIGSTKENNSLTLKQTKHVISRYSELIGGDSPFTVSDGVLTRYTGQGGDVAIPPELGVKTIGASAFRDLGGLTSVVIPEGVTAINEHAFEGCATLIAVTLPASLNSIGAFAFSGCTGLHRIFTHASTPPALIANTFAGINLSPVNLIVPAGRKDAHRAAMVWKDFGVITEVHPASDFVIVDGVLTKYAGPVFNVVIPPEVTAIGDRAFYGSRIVSVTMGEGITAIGASAFETCRELQSVSIPRTVTQIGDGAFRYAGLKEIHVNAANPAYASEDGVLFNKDKMTLLAYPMEKPKASYAIPEGVWTVASGSFLDNNNLKSVSVPASVNNIEMIAFQSCNNLETIEVNGANATYSSQDGVLYNKVKNLLIRYPGGKLGKVVIPQTVTEIGWVCFWDCERLDSIVIPSSVKAIEPDFGNFRSLRYMEVHWKTPLNVPSDLFMNVSLASATLSVPAGTKSLYQAATVWRNFGQIMERTNDTGTEAVAAEGLSVYCEGSILVINSPVAEDICFYSIGGKLLYRTAKAEGVLRLNADIFRERLIILQGNSGWTRKTVINIP
ncbi:MAG: leucine-rich repeat protein [Tannerellaceae bacterium]|jgi:hypothetical protein|nr:leucine-rich repeat protein [Tannerellaceae bacterium]